MGLLGTKTSFSFVWCISYWPQSSLQNDDLTIIFYKECFPTLFNISKTIMAVRKVREVFVDGPLKNINLLHFWKIHLLLVTIVSVKLWLKHAISAKMFLLVMLFHLFTFLLFWLFYFHFRQTSLLVKVFSSIFTILLPSVFNFTVYLWLLCNFILTFTDFYLIHFNHWYSLVVMLSNLCLNRFDNNLGVNKSYN